MSLCTVLQKARNQIPHYLESSLDTINHHVQRTNPQRKLSSNDRTDNSILIKSWQSSTIVAIPIAIGTTQYLKVTKRIR